MRLEKLGSFADVVVFLSLLLPAPLSGQVDVSVRVGRLGPSRPLVEEFHAAPSTGLLDIPEMRQRSSIAIGASVTHWPWSFIGVELDVLHSAVEVDAPNDPRFRLEGDPSILIGTVRALPTARITDRASLHAVLGLGLMDREAFRLVREIPGSTTTHELPHSTTRVWAIGGGARYAVRSGIFLRLDVEDQVWSSSFGGFYESLSPEQHDVIMTVGAAVRL